MTLRTVNDRSTVKQALNALAAIMVANTQLQQAGGTVSVDNDTPLLIDDGPWPALLVMETIPQTHTRVDIRLEQKEASVVCVYLQKWQETAIALDTLWAAVDDDMRRMQANLEENRGLIVSGTRNAVEVKNIMLSDYLAQAVDKDTYGVPVIKRGLSCLICLPPYPVLG